MSRGKLAAALRKSIHSFIIYSTRSDLFGALTHVVSDYIQHNPNILDGNAATFDVLSARLSTSTPQILHLAFSAPYGWVHHKDGNSTAIVDMYRFNETCIQEHWDVIQTVPANSTNPHPLF
jgi:predicted SnoaL-like aldol condensation-catalyzing enzyme